MRAGTTSTSSFSSLVEKQLNHQIRLVQEMLQGKAATPHQLRVWAACSLIPKGRVVSYGTLAKAIKSSPRAVGQALRANPLAPVVPCHRVVAATGALNGFNGSTSGEPMRKKAALLVGEGVNIENVSGSVSEGMLID
eukprot:PhM_4_TR14405/c0_g1_i1/m.29685/K00567/ogt, MGMT; methylated-DNA-[protein]-cysteine S-methyltransferase